MQLRHHIAKIVGLGLGLAFAGPLGGLVGAGIGLVIDRFFEEGLPMALRGEGKDCNQPGDPTDFILSSLILASAVIKADGEVSELELGYVHNFLAEQFGLEHAEKYMDVLRGTLQKDMVLPRIVQEIRQNTGYETRLQILYFLFGIANADYGVGEQELATIKIISIHLGLPREDYESIRAMFHTEMDGHFRILELTPKASDIEIKEAFHRISMKFHPDRVEHLGKQVHKAAQEKYRKVIEAYDAIRKERGMR